MALLFTVVGKTDDPELLAEEQYYVTCHRLGIDCQVAAKKKYEHHDWYTAQRFLPLIPKALQHHFIAIKEAA